MAVLFTSFLSAIGGGGGAAAGAAGAAGAVGGAAASGISWAGLASVGSTIVGGLASIMGGQQQKAALNAQARDEDMNAVQETINGRQEALMAMRKLNADLGSVLVAGYGSGLTPEGSIEAAQNEALKTGEANISMARTNAAYASAKRRQQSAQLRAEGKAAAMGGIFGAIQGGLSMFSRTTARG